MDPIPSNRTAPTQAQKVARGKPAGVAAGGAARRPPPGSFAVANLLRALLDPAARARGFAEVAILDQWPLIVGEKLCRQCQPLAVRFTPGQRHGGTLILRCGGAAALELQHGAPQLVERINRFFGFAAIRTLRLMPAPGFAGPPRPEPAPAPTLSPEAAVMVAASVGAVAHEELRLALDALGRAVHARAGPAASPATGSLARPGHSV